MFLGKNDRGLYVHRFDQGRFKLLVPARECGDVSHLLSHRVKIVRDVYETMPNRPFNGVRFVEIAHDCELCAISGPCFPLEKRKAEAEETALSLDEVAEWLETTEALKSLRYIATKIRTTAKQLREFPQLNFDQGDWSSVSWTLGDWCASVGRAEYVKSEPIKYVVSLASSPKTQEDCAALLEGWTWTDEEQE